MCITQTLIKKLKRHKDLNPYPPKKKKNYLVLLA